MFEIEGGSIMDSNAFMPRKPKPLPFTQPKRTNAYSQKNLRKIRPSNLTQPIRTASTLFGQFQKIRSPQYQIQKTRRQLSEIEDRKKLVELRKTLAKEKEMLDEAKREERNETISDLKNKIFGKKKFISEGGRKSVYE
jgi:hypothetical protein